MKDPISTSVLAMICMLAQALHGIAQDSTEAYELRGTGYTQDTLSRIRSFTGKSLEGNVYLHWKVSNQHTDGIYLIYRSSDKQHYKQVGQKAGIGVKIPGEVGYYFTDRQICDDRAYYKVVHLSQDKIFMSSQEIAIVPAMGYFSATK